MPAAHLATVTVGSIVPASRIIAGALPPVVAGAARLLGVAAVATGRAGAGRR